MLPVVEQHVDIECVAEPAVDCEIDFSAATSDLLSGQKRDKKDPADSDVKNVRRSPRQSKENPLGIAEASRNGEPHPASENDPSLIEHEKLNKSHGSHLVQQKERKLYGDEVTFNKVHHVLMT